MWAHIQEPPPSAAVERPELPESLDRVIATAMAKNKDDRYPTCSSFAAAAMAALETGTGRSFAGQATQPLPPVQPPPVPPHSTGTPPTTPIVVSSQFTRPEEMPPPAAPQYPPPAPPAPPQFPPQAGWTPGPYDSRPTSVQRNKPVTAIALIVAALLIAGGGTAAALIATKDKKSPEQSSASAPASPRTTGGSDALPPETTQRKPTVPTPPVTPKPQTPTTPVPSDPPADTGAADRAAVEAAAEGHWDAIARGAYGEAFDYFASTNPQNRSNWIAAHKRDKIESVDANWKAGSVNGASATARVVSLRTVSGNGCQDWSGYYDMVKEGGEWKIADSHLNDSPCG
jgi:serine/threonine-protein kinase